MGNNQGKPQVDELEEEYDIRVTESSPSSASAPLTHAPVNNNNISTIATTLNDNKPQIASEDIIQPEELSDNDDDEEKDKTTTLNHKNNTSLATDNKIQLNVTANDHPSSSDSDSESESEIMEKMYGFTKKGVTGQIKRPEPENNSNALKRKLVDLSKPKVPQEDYEWMKSISLAPDTPLIKLGDVISHVGNAIVIKADNEFTTGQRVWEEQNRQKSLTANTIGSAAPAKTALPPVNPVVVAPSSDAMNELVTKRMKQQQRRKMMSKNDEFRQEEAEWKKTIILRIGEGTVVFNNDRQPVGKISDVFGPVHQPFYKLIIGSNDSKKEDESHSDDEDMDDTDIVIEHKSKVPRMTTTDCDSINSLADINIPTAIITQMTEETTPSTASEEPVESTSEKMVSQSSSDAEHELRDRNIENGTECGDHDMTFTEAQHDTISEVEKKKEEQINMSGQVLYFVVQHSTIMNVSHVIDTTIQGTDATGEKDQELAPEDLEFSDDEDEANAKKKTRTHNNEFQYPTRGGRGGARGRGGRGGPRGRGRGRGGRFDPYSPNYSASPYDNTPVDYANFAAKFNSTLPTPSALMEPQNGEEHPSYDFQAPSSPQYTPSSPTYTPDN